MHATWERRRRILKSCNTIMIIGVGELGGILLEYLCRVPNICRIVVCDSNQDWGFRKVNSALHGAAYMGLYPDITFQEVDLLNIDQMAQILSKIEPLIIFNSTTLQSWWVVNELPPDLNRKIYKDFCGLGPWESMHLALAYKLMKAVAQAGIETYVVNTSYPDVTNVSLARVGLAPTVGIGNGDLAVPYIQKAVAEILHVPRSSVHMKMISHHYHAYHWCRDGAGFDAPHYLRIYVDSEDVTCQLGDMRRFIQDIPRHGIRPAGRHGQFVVAASALKNIMAIYNDTREFTHAPGPLGLEGGYPIRLSRRGAELALPTGITKEEARKIMLEAQKWDGIEQIRDNGDVVLTEVAYQTFKEMLGIDCPVVTLEGSYEQAKELKFKFMEFARKNGVAV
jgi:hypothetical protein